jgi:branched-chain amino acid aminotransferase
MDLQEIAKTCRVFLSMPWLEGLTPRVLRTAPGTESVANPAITEPLERRHGIFRPDEVGLSVFDHGALYGDSVFEGLLVVQDRLFTWREHLARLQSGSRSLGIPIPYDPAELTMQVLRTIAEADLDRLERAYVRLVLTRGLGDLGIYPPRCIGSTVFAIAARIQLYPEELYERGIELSVARQVRRPGIDVLDPNVKASNYLNNIRALLETLAEKRPETLMLTQEGFVSEATADNLFLVIREDGWKNDPGRVRIQTPPKEYCLEGITRSLILKAARAAGHTIEETSAMLPSDLTGAGREVFLTGTGAGLIPVVKIGHQDVGDGKPGPVTRELRKSLLADMADPRLSVAVRATRQEVEEYLAG